MRHISLVISMCYEIMAQHYGAKSILEVVHCAISSAFFRTPSCPTALPDQPRSPFTAELAQQALQLIPRLSRQNLLQLVQRASGVPALPEMTNEQCFVRLSVQAALARVDSRLAEAPVETLGESSRRIPRPRPKRSIMPCSRRCSTLDLR